MTSTLDYCRMLVGIHQSFAKQCWHFTMTFQSDLQRWKTAGASDAGQAPRWKRGIFNRGWWAWKNLRILATCCFWQHRRQREGSTLFFPVWLQTMRGFEAAHDSHGNGFRVPTIMYISFLEGGVKNDHKAENAKRGRFEALTLAFSRKSRTQQRDNKTKSQQVSYLWHQLAFHQHL